MNDVKISNNDNLVQLSAADILYELEKMGSSMSSEELNGAINKLKKWHSQAKYREKIEEQQRQQAERERKAQEEQKRKEEHIREVTCMDLPLDWNNIFNSDERTQGVHTESVSDALILSLNTLGRVDIEYISSITGLEYKEVIGALKGSIYQNPQTWNECIYKGWETADEYLSGNLMRKWRIAKDANDQYQGYFADNIKAIEAVLPPAVATKDIYITLGSPWVPTDIIDDFIEHLYKRKPQIWYSMSDEQNWAVKHDEITGTWEIPLKSRYEHSIIDTKTYGTDRIETLHILEKTLNMKSIAVTDKVQSLTNVSGGKRVINKAETILAIEKQQKLIKEFQEWVWKDEYRKERLEIIFENNFSCVRRRIYNGAFLNFPTMSKNIHLYPYQKNAVARIIFSSNTLLAHEVGSGKTFVMIAAGMEMRRMELSKKNLYVVPNNIVGQWKDIFLNMYPSAKLMSVEPKDFTLSKQNKVLEKIRDEEFDGIIMAYSCFDRIRLSSKFYYEQLQDLQDQVKKASEDIKKNTSRLRKVRKKIEEQLAELSNTINQITGLSNTIDQMAEFSDAFNQIEKTIFFDELGITRLFVDEAHNYKNVPFDTKASKALGINATGSKKCADMMDKVRMVQKLGGGVIMATATPITNSITDAFIMQKYLQNGELGLLDLQNFDSWSGMFAEQTTEFEIDVDTSSYRLATRFAKFHNIPELTSLFSCIADFHALDKTNDIPDFDGYTDVLVAKTSKFEHFLNGISKRADNVRNGLVYRTMDNMLKITTDGRKAALDMRLVDPKSHFTYQSKVARCAENVFDIYTKTMGTQIIFCDISVPKSNFNIYDEMERLLINMGIPDYEIAFIHDATNEKERGQLFRKMRKGSIRVLLGSTLKLGIGVNIQDKLIAIHHLDVPWRPADVGRILRTFKIKKNVEVTDNGKIII